MPSLTQSAWLVWITTLPVVIQFPTTPVDRPQTAVIQRAGAQQSGTPAKNPGREIFFSWGYNGDTYGKNDIHFDQPSLGNQFTYVAVRARDSKGWTDLFDHLSLIHISE